MLLIYFRFLNGVNNIIVLLNTGNTVERIDLKDKFENLKSNMVVKLVGSTSVYRKEQVIMLGELDLAPYEFLVLMEKENVLPFYR